MISHTAAPLQQRGYRKGIQATKTSDVKQNLAEDLKALREDINILHSEPAYNASYADDDSKYPASDALYDILQDACYGDYDSDPKWNRLLQAESRIDTEELDKFDIEPYDVTPDHVSRLHKYNGPAVDLKTVQLFTERVYARIKKLAKPSTFKAVISKKD